MSDLEIEERFNDFIENLIYLKSKYLFGDDKQKSARMIRFLLDAESVYFGVICDEKNEVQ